MNTHKKLLSCNDHPTAGLYKVSSENEWQFFDKISGVQMIFDFVLHHPLSILSSLLKISLPLLVCKKCSIYSTHPLSAQPIILH